MKNKIEIIKKIRKITNISILLCKKALEKNNFNIKKTLLYLKNINIKRKNIPKEGIIINKIKNNKAIMIKINCETDFTSRNKEFELFCKKILNFCFKKKNISLKDINKNFYLKKKYLISKFKENIIIKKICILKNKNLYNYLHNKRIGTILKYKNYSNKNKLKKIKKISMHITAMNPKYINLKEIKKKTINKEKKKISILIKNKNKLNKKLLEKLKNKCLLNQKFIFNNKLSIKEYLKKNKIKIKKFYRFEIKK